MMIDLVKYEMLKLWKKMKMTYFTISLMQLTILIITMIFMPDTLAVQIGSDGISSISNVLLGLLLMVYFISLLVIIFVPIAESCTIFSNDLSGKQSALELLLPPLTWKKIISKLIVVLLHTIFCILLALLFIVLFHLTKSGDNLNNLPVLQEIFSTILQSPLEIFLFLIGSFFSIWIICTIIYFSIACSKSLTHKKKIAIPIGIFMFVIVVTIYTFISFQLEKFPLYQYKLLGIEMNLSANLLDVIVFVIVFLGTTWLVDHKIEN